MADPDLQEVDRLVESGDLVEAVGLLAATNRREPDAEHETRLVDLRHQAVTCLPSSGPLTWPPVCDDPYPDVVGRLPEIDRVGLDSDALGGAVFHHGSLVVRNLLTEEQVSHAIDVVHEAERRREADPEGVVADRWYRPFPGGDDDMLLLSLRRRVARRGGTWLADSPAATAHVLDLLAEVGAIPVIAEHFGEHPLFTLQKSTLRRSLPVFNFAGWHQDGSFLGPRARAMNVWVALSPCGGDRPTPGLEVVPRRIDDILPTDGGLGSVSIADASVLRAAGDTPAVHPEFEAGDALLFDERLVHRTHLIPDMTRDRYALECWFFAPSHAARNYRAFLA